MEALGVLVLSMVVTVPRTNDRSAFKHVTLARYHGVSLTEAKELKARFCMANDELLPDYITGKWQVTEYI